MKILNDVNKGEASKPKKYRVKKHQNKQIQEPEAETDFQSHYTDLEGYTLDLGARASEKNSRSMQELELYLGATYSYR